jgi:signal transduction histidine kinase
MATRAGDRIAEEQSALRRVATLVARGVRPEEVFAAVSEEAGRVLDADFAMMGRYDPDRAATAVGTWERTEAGWPSVGTRWGVGGRNVTTTIFETSRPARIDDYGGASGPAADLVRGFHVHSCVGVPITVEGRLWGLMTVMSKEASLPADTEARLAGFTEMIATAIANAQARVELRGYAEEQAGLRRVATLVARGASPDEVFAAVAVEVGRVLDTEFTLLARYDPDGAATAVGSWARTDAGWPPVGTRWSIGGRNVTTLVLETGRPARIDDYPNATGPAADLIRDFQITSCVGVPITVEGGLWGLLVLATALEKQLTADSEARLAAFTELVATAIANAQARIELRGSAEEQAALRRVATLVARGTPPEQVFAAVSEEAGRVLAADFAMMCRYDADAAATAVGAWAMSDAGAWPSVGTRWGIGGRNVTTTIFETSRPARVDDYGGASGPAADLVRGFGVYSCVGVPITLEGRLWGLMTLMSKDAPLPSDTEARLAGFTELAATAIANAEAQAALTASRARIVATADATRRHIERDLHDGVQQRLVSLALELRAAQAAARPGAGDLAQRLDGVAAGLAGAVDELREIARGIHPAVLVKGGLTPALKALARRSAVPVDLHVQVEWRLPDPIEIAAYYVVSEALSNTTKHARASAVDVRVDVGDGDLRVRVHDDGCGGAEFGPGSGLLGIRDRVEALGGRISLHSPPGTGTTLEAHVPAGQREPRG